MALMIIFTYCIFVLSIANGISIPSYAPMTISNCDDNMQMEQSRVTVSIDTKLDNSVYLYGVSSNCYHCLILPLSYVPLNYGITGNNAACVTLDTNHPYTIVLSNEKPFSDCDNGTTCAWQPDESSELFKITKHYNQFSHYDITITSNNKYKISETKKAYNKYIPLFILCGFIILILIIYNCWRFYQYRIFEPTYDQLYGDVSDYPASSIIGPKMDSNNKKPRLVSLDAFRGLALIVMIFVNYGGGGYWWLNHSTWNGLTVADLVFPWFIFIMGTAMSIVFPRYLAKCEESPWNASIPFDDDSNSQKSNYSEQRRLSRNVRMMTRSSGNNGKTDINQRKDRHNVRQHNVNTTLKSETGVYTYNQQNNKKEYTKWNLIKRVIIRGIKLYLIGMILNGGYYLTKWRIPGVLQYFAISYTINSLLIIFTEPNERTVELYNIPECRNLFIPEITLFWKQWIINLILIGINLFLIYFLNINILNSKCPKGYIGPGGIGDYGKYIECTGGVHRLIDLKIFGMNHIYQTPTVQEYYSTGYYDPEGLLGSLTATFMTFLGIFAGRILYIYIKDSKRLIRWWVYVIILGGIAAGLCGMSQNGGTIPLNKNMWSISFIITQACTGIFLLSIMYILIDVLKIWDGKPFHWLGRNSIVIYVGSEIMQSYFPWSFQIGKETHYQLLLSNIIGVSLWILTAWYLYNKKIFYNL